ncbi:sensor histidine kinase [uncultured Psychroserpens sp.]|uniref:tetratricopeptide repeat-containing sensor histidine kinase n=1 Tax=uncultured Psychroserpens sp. TaxID=255436 RepID=UPI00261ED13C|nr:sensor histidine kinase [uncultured Psychroserpens sp.]
MKYITFLFFLITSILFAQPQKDIDSMYQVVRESLNDTIKANTHYELAWSLKLKNLPKAKAHMDSAMSFYQGLKLPRKVALSHFQYSVLHRIAGDYNKAIESLTKYQNYVETVNDTTNLTYAYYEKGVIYSQKGDLHESLEAFYKANTLSEATQNLDMSGTTLNSIGLVYNDLQKYDEAIEAFNKVLVIYKELNITSEHLGDVYNGMGSAYKHQKKYSEANIYFDKALANYHDNNSAFGVAISNFHKGLICNEQKQYKKALTFFKIAYDIQKENGFETELILTLSSFAEAHFELGHYSKSESLLNEGLGLEIESKLSARDLYFELYRINAKKNNYSKALQFHELYVKYKDSVYNEENINSINLLQKQFETEKKDKEIVTQKLALQEQENEIQKQHTQLGYITGIAIFLLIAALLTWLLFQQKQKRKNQELIALKREYQIKSLESLIEGEEKERFRIAKELHDGVNGDLSAIKYKLSSLLEMNNKVIKEAITMIDSSCEQVRAISHNLVPPSLDSFNLVEATENYCINLNATNKERITFQHIGSEVQLSKKAEVNVFRIIQELVFNAIKHAEADEISVQISSRDNQVQITVEDDGKGFDSNAKQTEGIGLSNIQSRIDYLNANLDVVSNKEGTSYSIEIDLNTLNED